MKNYCPQLILNKIYIELSVNFTMPCDFHLPVFAKNFATYLKHNLIGQLSTDNRIRIKFEGQLHTLSMNAYLHDASFGDRICLGEYVAQYIGNTKIKQEFKSDSLPLGPIHLVYENEKGERKDNYQDIPFP